MKRDNLVHQVRDSLVRLPEPYGNHYGVIPAAPPEEHVDLGEAGKRVNAALEAAAIVDAIARELKDPYIISRILPRQEAVSSSAIEGTNSTLDELLSVEEGVEDDTSDAARQVRSYADALDDYVPKARAGGAAIFTSELIQDLHRKVMVHDADYKDEPGALRQDVVWIGGTKDIAYSTWNPPPPAALQKCLTENVDYLRNEGMQQMNHNLIVRMAVAHVHFEAVHPFRDGNGRVGRLVLPLMMAAEKRTPLYLSPYIEANKDAYYSALREAQQRLRWDAAIGFLADAVVGTKDELIATRGALKSLAEIWRERRKFRAGSAALRSLDLLPHYPVITTRRLGQLLAVTYKQANQAVDQLQEAGILQEATGYSRNRIFSATEALSIINRPFGEEPVIGRESEPDAAGLAP